MRVIIFKLLAIAIGIKFSRIFHIGAAQSVVVFIIIGHLIDIFAEKKLNELRIKNLENRAQRNFLNKYIVKDFYLLLGQLCTFDGGLNQAHLFNANKIAQDVFKLNHFQSRQALYNMRKKTLFKLPLEKKLQGFSHLGQDFLNNCYKILLDHAAAGGKMNKNKKDFLETIAKYWNINVKSSNTNKKRTETNKVSSILTESYQILESKIEDSDQEIKKKYRKLVTKYHPDKISSKDIPEELLALASEKFQKIQQAYEEVMRSRK